MGFMDKAKEAATQAAAMAQQGISQGQQKLDELAQQRDIGELHRQLGEAFYAEQRNDGPRQAVLDALAQIDQWHAQEGQSESTAGSPQQETGSPGAGPQRAGPDSGPADTDRPPQDQPPRDRPPRDQPGGFTLDGL